MMMWHQISGGLGPNDGHDGLADGLTGEEEVSREGCSVAFGNFILDVRSSGSHVT